MAVARQHGYALLQFVVEDAFFVKQSELHKFGGVTPERKSPAAAFAIGNPFTYYFDPGLFKRRRGGGAAGSFPRGVSEDWARRGRGGVGAAGSVAPLTQYQRDELKSYVLGNVSAIGQRLFGMGAEQLAEVVSVGIDQEAWLG